MKQLAFIRKILPYGLSALALVLCGVTTLVGVAMAAPPSGSGPVIVVARPWGPSADAIAAAAGAQPVGPNPAPLSVIAAGADVQAYFAAGAFAVLDPGAVPFLCSPKEL